MNSQFQNQFHDVEGNEGALDHYMSFKHFKLYTNCQPDKIVNWIPLQHISFGKPKDRSDVQQLDKLKSDARNIVKIRWLRSYNKLNQQLRVINAFRLKK